AATDCVELTVEFGRASEPRLSQEAAKPGAALIQNVTNAAKMTCRFFMVSAMIDPQDTNPNIRIQQKESTVALETWQIDPVHSCIHFSIRHFVVSKIHGRFSKWGGTIQLDEASPASSTVEIHIDAASIDTNEPNRDKHLQGPDFLNVAEHPQLTFQSTR